MNVAEGGQLGKDDGLTRASREASRRDHWWYWGVKEETVEKAVRHQKGGKQERPPDL